jgi:protein-S-isoprenylcysteine O-methyltransferase Ste14
MPGGKSLLSRLVRLGIWGQLVLLLVVFIPAGTLKYWQGWSYLLLNLTSTFFFCRYFYKRDPQLLERRLLRKEKVRAQKFIMLLMKLSYAFVFMLPGLDHRLGWSLRLTGPVPIWLVVLSLGVIPGCYLWFVVVMNANRFAASIIQVEAGQTVMDTGPYRIIRHPMYLGGVILWLFTPLALGSFVTLPAFGLLIPIVVLRLLNEEKFLRRELPGYTEYCRRVRYRITPFVW